MPLSSARRAASRDVRTSARAHRARKALAILLAARPASLRESSRCRAASDHLRHRLLGRRHHLGAEHLRADLPPREGRRGLHRGRRLSPLPPREMRARWRRRREKGNGHFSHFGPSPTCSPNSKLFRDYGALGTRHARGTTSTTTGKRSSTTLSPAPSPKGGRCRRRADLLFYEGLHGARRHRQGHLRAACGPEDRRRAGDQPRMDPETAPRPHGARLFRPRR